MAQRPNNSRLNGIFPLSYLGVNPTSPTNQTIQTRRPLVTDAQGFYLGDEWLIPTANPREVWKLVNLERGIGTWVQLYPGGGGSGASVFPTDNNTATQIGGVLNVLGGANINTSAPGISNTVQIQLNNNVDIPGTLTLSGYGIGVLQAPFIAGPVFSSTGMDGQVLIGATVGNAAWADITSLDGTVVVSNGANTIDLSVANVTNPAASCTFFYYQATTAFGVTGGSSPSPVYQLGASVALTSLYDNTGGAVNPGNGIGVGASFTAPATGVYCLQLTCSSSRDIVITYLQVTGTSAHVYYPAVGSKVLPGLVPPFNETFGVVQFSSIIPMTSGDIVVWNVMGPFIGTVITQDIFGNSQPYLETPSGFRTWISGYRIL